MSYFRDCRTDEYYNEKYLNKTDSEFIAGFDWCAEHSVETFFDCISTFFEDLDIEGEDINIARFFENHHIVREKFKECLLEWIEEERDEMITSMIDNMPEGEYEEIKSKVDKGE